MPKRIFQILSINNEMTDLISVSSPQADKNLLLLIDTEAQISVMKKSMLKKELSIDTNDIISLKGITDEIQLSLGSVDIILIFEHLSIRHKVHVVPDDFQIPAHGILGKDFLKIHKCLIDYNSMTLTVRQMGQQSARISIQAELLRGLSALPARSETFKMFRLKSKSYPCISYPAQEVAEHIFVPSTIAISEECWIRVLNVSDKIRVINTQNIKVSQYDEFDVFKYKNVKHEKRTNELTKILKTRIPDHAKQSLLPLCLEFEDIFHVEGDKPTVNNFYEQSLRTKDPTPVNTKNYRVPQTQKAEMNDQVKKLLAQDLIEMSRSNYNSPLIIVPKKVPMVPKSGACASTIGC